MKRWPRILAVVLMVWAMLAAAAPAPAAKVFRATDFGAVADGRTDAGPAIRRAIGVARECGGPVEVVLEAGRYRIAGLQDARFCFVIHGAHDLTLRGVPGKTEIVIGDPRFLAFSIAGCTNVFLKDFAIDYDPLPFTQGRVVAVDRPAGTFNLQIDPGYSRMTEPWFADGARPSPKLGVVMDPAVRRLKASVGDHLIVTRWAPVAGTVLRIVPQDNYKGSLADLAVGDRFAITARSPSGTLEFSNNSSGGMDGVTIYAGPGLAVLVAGNQGPLEFRRCAIRFKPGTSRLLSTNGDGFHCAANRKGPVVEDGYFEGMPDDTMNIYCPPDTVLDRPSATWLLVTASTAIRPGDRLQIFDASAGVRAEVTAVSAEPRPEGYRLTLAHPVEGVRSQKDGPPADTVYNLSACGQGFVFRRNTIGPHRRHGILVRAVGGLIEGNIFDHVAGCGVAVGNEPHWPEGPVPRNIVIRNNRFLGGGQSAGYNGTAVSVLALKDSGYARGRPVTGMVIEANTFLDQTGPAITLAATQGAIIRNNHITAGPDIPRPRGPTIEIRDSAGLVLDRNTIDDRRPQTLAAVELAPDVAPGTAGVAIHALEARLAPNHTPVLDRRGQ